jgi:hypothetical protein
MITLGKELKIKKFKNGVAKNGNPYSMITISDANRDMQGNTNWQNVVFWSNDDLGIEEGDKAILRIEILDENGNEKTSIRITEIKSKDDGYPDLPF